MSKLFGPIPFEEKYFTTWKSMISGYEQSKNGLKFVWELFEKKSERLGFMEHCDQWLCNECEARRRMWLV